MKFLIHGNAPTIFTGYSVQILNLAKCLQADGHDVAISSTYGLQGGVNSLHGIRIYGCGYDMMSNDLFLHHALHHFRDEPGWIITVTDVWGIKNPGLREFNVLAWTPVDHFTSLGCQPNVREFFESSDAVPVAMSRFGEDMLRRPGLDPLYIPLSVDTTEYKPTPTVSGNVGSMTGRQLMGVPEDAFVVGMVAMNKGWARDRKGFNEAFAAMGRFMLEHDDVYFYVHSEKYGGAEGIDLTQLAIHSGLQPHRLKWAGGDSQYGYRIGYSFDMMAACYTGMDVLLAPSHGEGFCVPMIEAQACGTPVIASRFAAQTELVPEGCGWLIDGQQEWDPALHAFYKTPYIEDVIQHLEEAYVADRVAMGEACIRHAAQYDTKYVYETMWRPLIDSLSGSSARIELSTQRTEIPETNGVAVLCPIHDRKEHIAPLIESFMETTPAGAATLYLITDELVPGVPPDAVAVLPATRGTTCAARWNAGFEQTLEPWVLCIGDDVRFRPGWLEAARKVSADFDVIGTNDTTGAPKNPKVANGSHADHFFVRRSYVTDWGGCLNGPGVLAPEEYHHWFTDMEIVKLAKARGVFTPCLDSVVEHLHPGYDGDEDARYADTTYVEAVQWAEEDQSTFAKRMPLIEMQRTGRAKL